MAFEIRKTDFEEGARLQVVDTYFHPFKLGESVIVFSKDLHSYHVRSDKPIHERIYCWVSENQVVEDGGWVNFETDFGVKAKYRFDKNGETILKIVSKCSKGQYYSIFNQVGDYFDNEIMPIVNRKHVSQSTNNL